MLIYGYTEAKMVEPVEVPIEQVVAEGIDPWRLDLFDNDPLRLRFDNKQLFFRKLRDVCFSYGKRSVTFGEATERGWPHWLCIHNGEMATAVETRLRTVDGKSIRTVTPSLESFAQHLTNYLSHPIETLPRPASAAQMRGDDVGIDMSVHSFWGYPITFIGKMHEERAVQCELPEPINRVFTEFEIGDPAVTGPALRKAMAKQKLARVDVVVDVNAWPAIADRFARHLVEPYTVELDGVKYEVTRRNVRTVSEVIRLAKWERSRYSADTLYATHKNQVCGSRIAFFDLGRVQTRLLSPELEVKELKDDESAQLSLADGLQIVPAPTNK